MATKITISKALERGIRECSDPRVALDRVVELLDAAQAKKTEQSNCIAAAPFLNEIEKFRPVIRPTHNGSAALYSRLARKLRDLGVTADQATALGSWLKDQKWIPELTIERFCQSLSEWLTRALNKPATAKSEFKRVKWEDA